jgi:hypothetical protein
VLNSILCDVKWSASRIPDDNFKKLNMNFHLAFSMQPFKILFSAVATAPINLNAHWGTVFSHSERKVVYLTRHCPIHLLKIKYHIPFIMTFHPFDNVDKSACLKCTNTEKRESKWSRMKSVPTSLIAFLQSVKTKILINY